MSLLGAIRSWITDIAKYDKAKIEYDLQLEYIKGFLGDHPREKLQSMITSEECLKAALRQIKASATFMLYPGKFSETLSRATLEVIAQTCSSALNSDSQQGTQEFELP